MHLSRLNQGFPQNRDSSGCGGDVGGGGQPQRGLFLGAASLSTWIGFKSWLLNKLAY